MKQAYPPVKRIYHSTKRAMLLCATILLSAIMYGQDNPLAGEPGSRHITLDEAIARALQHSPGQLTQQVKVEEARLQVKNARLQHIPTVYASGDLRRNLIIPSTPVPAYLFNPDAGEDETMYLKFNTRWNASAGLNLTYDLFNPDKVYATSEREQQLKIQEYDALISEQEARERISLSYAECIIAMEQLHALAMDTAYFSRLLAMADTLHAREKIPMTERNEARVARNESVSNYLMGEKIVRDSKAELLYLMGEEITPEAIDLLYPAESLPSLLEKLDRSYSASRFTGSLEETRQTEAVKLAGLRVKSATLKYAPTLMLNGYLGSNMYNRELSLFDHRFWRGYSYIGLSVSVPITQSLHRANEVSRLRLLQQVERETLRDLQNEKTKEELDERSLLEVRRENYRLSLENLELNRQNARAGQVEYEKGYILQQDLLNRQRALQNARQNYLQSAYEIIASLIALQKNNLQF